MIRSIHTNFSKDVPVSTYGDCGATLTTVIDGEQKINIFSLLDIYDLLIDEQPNLGIDIDMPVVEMIDEYHIAYHGISLQDCDSFELDINVTGGIPKPKLPVGLSWEDVEQYEKEGKILVGISSGPIVSRRHKLLRALVRAKYRLGTLRHR